jgi:hypothetical protein
LKGSPNKKFDQSNLALTPNKKANCIVYTRGLKLLGSWTLVDHVKIGGRDHILKVETRFVLALGYFIQQRSLTLIVMGEVESV